MKAKIFDCSRTCGDGCCSWAEVYVLHEGARYSDFHLLQSAIDFCITKGWEYELFSEVDEEYN